jgi:S-formylglutathione hydrolase FrmB
MAFIDCHFFSEALRLSCSMHVILPQAASSKQVGIGGAPRRARCATLYLLHGLSDDHTIWSRRTAIERHVAGLPLAVVMPAVARSYYQDMASGPRYWTFVSEELPRLARSFFPLSGAREDTFAAGLSMGGYGAFRLALAHPRRFAAAASLSGALDAAAVPAHMDPKDADAVREWQSVFGPRFRIAGSDADLFHLARRAAASRGPKPKLFQYCGTGDFLYQDNLRFRDHAARLGLDLVYREDAGAHTWDRWDEWIRAVIEWLPLRGRPRRK